MKRKFLITLFATAIGLAMTGALAACDLFGGGDGEDKVDGTQGLYYSPTDDGLTYAVGLPSGTENDWDDAEIVIPASYKGKPVTGVIGKGFENSGIKSVSLPDSVKKIGSGAFEGCAKLKSVSFGNGVTEIESYAFGSTGLETVEIPANVAKIGGQAFEKNASLTAVTVYGNAEVGYKAFQDCTALRTAEFLGEESLSLDSSVFSDCTALESVTLVADSVTLDDNAFMDCKFTRYTATLETVYKSNFAGNIRSEFPSELVFLRTEEFPAQTSSAEPKFGRPVSVTLPATLKKVGENVFYNSKNLTEVVFGGTLAQWCAIEFENEYSNPLNSGKARLAVEGSVVEGKLTIPAEIKKVGDYAFYKYAGIRELEIAGATEIGKYAFAQNTRLYSATLPEGLTAIREYAFSECALVEVTLPESLTALDAFVFYKDRKLVRIVNRSGLDSATIDAAARYVSNDFKIVTAPDGSAVEKIGEFVFRVNESGSYSLMLYAGNETEITLPATANGNKYAIHSYAFFGFSLEKITFADTENWVRQKGNSQPAAIDVTDPEQNANNLQSTYYDYEWYRN